MKLFFWTIKKQNPSTLSFEVKVGVIKALDERNAENELRALGYLSQKEGRVLVELNITEVRGRLFDCTIGFTSKGI